MGTDRTAAIQSSGAVAGPTLGSEHAAAHYNAYIAVPRYNRIQASYNIVYAIALLD